MNRQEKQLKVESIKSDFKSNQASFIIGVKGMTVEAVQGLRKNLHSKGSTIKVAKNTLLKIATQDIEGLNQLAPYFKEQIAIVFASTETPAIAQILFNLSKENEKLKLIGGSLNEKIIDKSQIEQLALLPSREVLLAKVLGTMKAPASKVVSLLNQVTVRLLWVLKQAAESKQ